MGDWCASAPSPLRKELVESSLKCSLVLGEGITDTDGKRTLLCDFAGRKIYSSDKSG